MIEIKPDFLIQLYGLSAYISAFATIFTFITGILFFKKGKMFGLLNDLSSILQVIFIIPLVFYFFTFILTDSGYILSTFIFILGLTGILFSIYGQGLLVTGRINFDQSRKFFPAGAAIGLWLFAVCLIASIQNLIPSLLGWIGIIAGFGYILTVVGFRIGGYKNWLFHLGGFILGISYPVWAVWLGLLLLQ